MYWLLTDNGGMPAARSILRNGMLTAGRSALRIGYRSIRGDTRWAQYRINWTDNYRSKYHMRWIQTANGKITSRRSILRVGCPPLGHVPGPLGGAGIFPCVLFPNDRLRRVAVACYGAISCYGNAFRVGEFEELYFCESMNQISGAITDGVNTRDKNAFGLIPHGEMFRIVRGVGRGKPTSKRGISL